MQTVDLQMKFLFIKKWVLSCTTYQQTHVCRQFAMQLMQRNVGKLGDADFMAVRALSAEVDIRNFEILKHRFPQLFK